MQTIQSRVYTNVILTVIALLLAANILAPLMKPTQAVAQRERPSLIPPENTDATDRIGASAGDSLVAGATKDLASATREIADAIRESAKSNEKIGQAISKLATAP